MALQLFHRILIDTIEMLINAGRAALDCKIIFEEMPNYIFTVFKRPPPCLYKYAAYVNIINRQKALWRECVYINLFRLRRSALI